jgi:type IV pilus assembly protein PilO
MNPQLQRQILIGAVTAIVVAGLTYFATNPKRDEQESLKVANADLEKKVEQGKMLKRQYEQLREEVEKQQKRIDDLIKIMPNDADINELPYKVKKLSDGSGLDQTAFAVKPERKDQYYTEKMMDFEFRGGFHSFGQFASLVSGYERIINVSNMELTRLKDPRGIYSATIKCTVSAFVYNPAEPTPAPAAKPAAPAPKGGGKED